MSVQVVIDVHGDTHTYTEGGDDWKRKKKNSRTFVCRLELKRGRHMVLPNKDHYCKGKMCLMKNP